MVREPLTAEVLVTTSRELLVEGGPDAVVVREVARRLGVTAPALYRHVGGREDLLTLLIAACYEEVADSCAAALRGCEPGDPEGRLREATLAFRAWSTAHPPEFGLLYGTPIPGYTAPQDGPTTTSAQRLGQLFGVVFVELLQAGRLRKVADEQLSPRLREDLRRTAQHLDLPMRAGELYPFVVGWQRMLGVVSVEVSGHLRWAFGDDAGPFVERQLADLAADLLLPTSAAPPG